MAKTVTIEFTDAQWELILANYPTRADGKGKHPDALTEDILATYLLEDVKNMTTMEVQQKVATAQKDAFDV